MQNFKSWVRSSIRRGRGLRYRIAARGADVFECPICSYKGPFKTANDASGIRPHAICPVCGCVERHRVLALSVNKLAERMPLRDMHLLHFAPERELRDRFRTNFGKYETADLNAPNVDYTVDLLDLPFPDASFDAVIACHVLEHISDDQNALRNIRRILSPEGFAILQVPIFGPTTVEYPEPNVHDWGHVRAPGEDYFRRFEKWFSRIEVFKSSDFPAKNQPFIFEDRERWPEHFSLRPTTHGAVHDDLVPVCYV